MPRHTRSMLCQRLLTSHPAIKAHNASNPGLVERIVRQNLGLLIFHALQRMFEVTKEYIGLSQLLHHRRRQQDRKSTRLNSSHVRISYAVFCLKKKKTIRKSV